MNEQLARLLLAAAQKRFPPKPIKYPYPVKDIVSIPIGSTPDGMNAGMALTGIDMNNWYRGN